MYANTASAPSFLQVAGEGHKNSTIQEEQDDKISPLHLSSLGFLAEVRFFAT